MSVCDCVHERERVYVCVCAYMRACGYMRARFSVCVWGGGGYVCVCVCVCVCVFLTFIPF